MNIVIKLTIIHIDDKSNYYDKTNYNYKINYNYKKHNIML